MSLANADQSSNREIFEPSGYPQSRLFDIHRPLLFLAEESHRRLSHAYAPSCCSQTPSTSCRQLASQLRVASQQQPLEEPNAIGIDPQDSLQPDNSAKRSLLLIVQGKETQPLAIPMSLSAYQSRSEAWPFRDQVWDGERGNITWGISSVIDFPPLQEG